MQEHRIYYISEQGRIVGVDDVLPTDEAEARARAEALIGDHFGIEIWRGAERVAQLRNEARAAKAPAAAHRTG